MSQNTYAPAGAKSKAVKTKSVEEAQAPVVSREEDVVGKRIEEMRAARKERRHVDQGGMSNQKLSVSEALKDPRLTYRWVNDKATRVHAMKQKGWQIADDAALAKDDRNSGVGSVVERIVNERTTPTVERGFLMWKPKEFYEEDKAKEAALIKQRETGLKRGETLDPQGLPSSESYIPEGGMKIEHM